MCLIKTWGIKLNIKWSCSTGRVSNIFCLANSNEVPPFSCQIKASCCVSKLLPIYLISIANFEIRELKDTYEGQLE